ncbi:MAG: XdhC family protein, partial [Litoreibacter sp.]|nr:XdhC family protein [Litoreibacter sp.]
ISHGFAEAGLIGSDTKWARFRRRLAALGHSDAQISRIRCPIGQKELGKHPQAIALGTAAALLSVLRASNTEARATGGYATG